MFVVGTCATNILPRWGSECIPPPTTNILPRWGSEHLSSYYKHTAPLGQRASLLPTTKHSAALGQVNASGVPATSVLPRWGSECFLLFQLQTPSPLGQGVFLTSPLQTYGSAGAAHEQQRSWLSQPLSGASVDPRS